MRGVALFQYLQPSTQCTWSLDLSPQSITLRRATLGKNTGVVTFVSATTAETESAHVRRTLLTAVEFGGDTSSLSCTFCASARDSMAKFDRFLLFSASLGCQCSPIQGNGRKLRKSIKGRTAKVVSYRLPPTQSDCAGNNSKWALSCFTSRSKPPSILPAQISVFQNQRAAQQAITPADVNFTPIFTRSKSFSDNQKS